MKGGEIVVRAVLPINWSVRNVTVQFITEKQEEMPTVVVWSILLVYRTEKKTIHYGNIVYCSIMDSKCNSKLFV